MATLNLPIFKYLLGCIRVVEFLLIVIAIACVNSWKVSLDYDCPDGTKHRANVATFSSAIYFYFVNVAALIDVLIFTFIYVVFWEVYKSEKSLARVDIALMAFLLGLLSSCSGWWWAGSNTIIYATGEERITQLMKGNPNFWYNSTSKDLHLMRDTSNGKLTTSVVCDWVCFFTFVLNYWIMTVVPRPEATPLVA